MGFPESNFKTKNRPDMITWIICTVRTVQCTEWRNRSLHIGVIRRLSFLPISVICFFLFFLLHAYDLTLNQY